MFNGKKIKELIEKVEKLEKFEQRVCTIVDSYFKTNKGADTDFYTDSAIGKFCCFVESVDSRIKYFEKVFGNGEFVRKELHDEQVMQLQEEINADNDELAEKDEKIENLTAIVKHQEKELKQLSEEKRALQIQLIAKNRATEIKKTATAKRGQK